MRVGRRQFLATTGLALPAASLLQAAAQSGSDRDVPLQRDQLRIALLHASVTAIDLARAASERAALLTRWTTEVERLSASVVKPDLIVLPAYALTGWDHWSAVKLRVAAPDLHGAELHALRAVAQAQRADILLAGWWRRNGKVSEAAAWIARSGAVTELPPFDGTHATIAHTPLGNWAYDSWFLSRYAHTQLAATGIECLLTSGQRSKVDGAAIVTVGRAYPAPPPGCPDVLQSTQLFASSVRDLDRRCSARSLGSCEQIVHAQIDIGAIRAARRSSAQA